MDQADIHHGHFIDDDHIRVERIFLVPLKMHALQPVFSGIPGIFRIRDRRPGQLQKAMDRLCLISGRLRHALCRTPRRGRQKDLHIFLVKIVDDRVDRRCFTSSRSSGDNKETIAYRLHHRLLLELIQLDLLRLRDLFEPFFHVLLIDLRVDIQIMQHSRRIEFHIVELCRIDDPLSVLLLHHQLLLHLEIHQVFFHVLRFHI